MPKDARWKLEARNTYILFANELDAVDGVWNDNHALEGGWSILGDLTVQEFPTSASQTDLENSISVYPSPNNGNFTIAGDFQDYTVEVLSVYGALQQRLSGQNGLTRVDISDLPAGVYLVNIRFVDTAQTYTRKIIKQD